jgi:hypothetical protein
VAGWSAATVLWTIFTVVFFAVVSVLILRQPGFPLGLGLIQTHGLSGLWVTAPSFLAGMAGLLLFPARPSAGTKLLTLYSGFWTLTLFIGVLKALPDVIRQPLALCTRGTCATLPVAIAVVAAFALCFAWYSRHSHPLFAHR